ncbi:MAG: hypothetical protein M3Y23_04745, partial [Actinomycetota bacterium]|nr:hypothetical protein [Actinomycetota bacterium]
IQRVAWGLALPKRRVRQLPKFPGATPMTTFGVGLIPGARLVPIRAPSNQHGVVSERRDEKRGGGLSALSGAATAGGFVAKRGDQLKRRLQEGAHGGLIGDPLLGLEGRRENSAAVANGAVHDAPVHEMKKDGQATAKRDSRPVLRSTEFVLQVQPDVAERLLVKRVQVLIVPMNIVVGQAPRPLLGELTY